MPDVGCWLLVFDLFSRRQNLENLNSMVHLRKFLLLLVLCHAGPSRGQRDNLPPQFYEYIDSQEAVVKEIVQRAEEWHERRVELVRECTCSRHGCSNDYLDSPCVHYLGTPQMCGVDGRRIDNTSSSFRTPRGTNPNSLSTSLKESTCVYRPLEDLVINELPSGFGWTYLGTRDGHFRIYPAAARPRGESDGEPLLGNCASYDPRVRPWYVAASTGPKDVVIVVDKSGSMNDRAGYTQESKWVLTERALKDILDTFTFTDFVNVVTFDSKARALWTDSELLRGESKNIEDLKTRLETVTPSGETRFEPAFEAAFRLLTNACQSEGGCSNCHKIILFLTDGEDTSDEGGSIQPSVLLEAIGRMQDRLEDETGNRAFVFTYSISDIADDRIPRQIACANRGAWSFIGPNTNTLDALNSYYLYFANSRTEKPIWIEPYEDSDGLGVITTVAMPFHAGGTDDVPDVFLGVAGRDVAFHELEVAGVTYEQALNAIIDRSAGCTHKSVLACEEQVYRDTQEDRAQCPDRYPPETNGDVSCYRFGAHVYKMFRSNVQWDRAQENCEDDGGSLVSIENSEELAFVCNLAADDGSWIGAQAGFGGAFNWIQSSLAPLPDDSAFWGKKEPVRKNPGRDCAAIDSRGVIGNILTLSCQEDRSYVCKYSSEASCPDGVAPVPEEGYFVVPPIDSCESREILAPTEPVEDVNLLDSSDVICPLGEPQKNDDTVCCGAGPKSSNDLVQEAWFWIIIVFALVVILVAFCLWRARKRVYAFCGAHGCVQHETKNTPQTQMATKYVY